MFDIVDMIFEYWSLSDTSVPRSDAQQKRLDALKRLLQSPTFEVREWSRLEANGPVEFSIAPGTVALGRILDLCGGGMGIETRRPLRPGTETKLRFADPVSGQGYCFPVVVVWARDGEGAAMGVRFAGVPRRLVASHDSGRLRIGSAAPGLEFEDTGLAGMGRTPV